MSFLYLLLVLALHNIGGLHCKKEEDHQDRHLTWVVHGINAWPAACAPFRLRFQISDWERKCQGARFSWKRLVRGLGVAQAAHATTKSAMAGSGTPEPCLAAWSVGTVIAGFLLHLSPAPPATADLTASSERNHRELPRFAGRWAAAWTMACSLWTREGPSTIQWYSFSCHQLYLVRALGISVFPKEHQNF
jgi:hypothetical protein